MVYISVLFVMIPGILIYVSVLYLIIYGRFTYKSEMTIDYDEQVIRIVNYMEPFGVLYCGCCVDAVKKYDIPFDKIESLKICGTDTHVSVKVNKITQNAVSTGDVFNEKDLESAVGQFNIYIGTVNGMRNLINMAANQPYPMAIGAPYVQPMQQQPLYMNGNMQNMVPNQQQNIAYAAQGVYPPNNGNIVVPSYPSENQNDKNTVPTSLPEEITTQSKDYMADQES